MSESQCTRILAWLQLGKPLTASIALSEFGCSRLAARIQDLEERGNVIHSRIIKVRNRYGETCRVAEYSLMRLAQAVTV